MTPQTRSKGKQIATTTSEHTTSGEPSVHKAQDANRTLWCLVRDHPGVFSVEISIHRSVDYLKKAIKLERKPKLDHLPADSLILWRLNEMVPIKPARDILVRAPWLVSDISNHATELEEPSDTVGSLFPSSLEGHLHILVQFSAADEYIYTDQWIALKRSSRFYLPSGSVSSTPVVDGVLRVHDSPTMLAISDSECVSTIFIRECYISWFDRFLEAVKKRPMGKFALCSSPGCGKTTADNFIFKIAASDPFLSQKSILYQFKEAFYHFKSDTVYGVDRNTARTIACLPETFYILDGRDADPVRSTCLTLFISSPRSNIFKDWCYHAMIEPWYLPVWSLEELRNCRTQCHPTISQEVVDHRYEQYGGIARYVFWPEGEPPSIEGVVSDTNARQSIRSVGEPSQLFPTSHMLLHISTDENLHFKHVALASRYVGRLLFSKYFDETFENLKSLLGGRGALAGHLFECYVHYLFENGHEEPLICRSLEGDNKQLKLPLPLRDVEVFDIVPENLPEDKYYVPLSANFAAIDALTKDAALQYTITDAHPVKGVQVLAKLASLFPSKTLVLLFVVPESIAPGFSKQPILTSKGTTPENVPAIRQFVVGLPLGIDTSSSKKRKLVT